MYICIYEGSQGTSIATNPYTTLHFPKARVVYHVGTRAYQDILKSIYQKEHSMAKFCGPHSTKLMPHQLEKNLMDYLHIKAKAMLICIVCYAMGQVNCLPPPFAYQILIRLSLPSNNATIFPIDCQKKKCIKQEVTFKHINSSSNEKESFKEVNLKDSSLEEEERSKLVRKRKH